MKKQQTIRDHLIASLLARGIIKIDGKPLEQASFRRLLGVLALQEAANS